MNVADAGLTSTLAAGGGSFWSLQLPKLFWSGPLQNALAPLRWSDVTGAVGPVPGSLTPMLYDVMPAAGPFTAVMTPSYEKNSTTLLSGRTSAIPAGPSWIPGGLLTIWITTPRPLQLAFTTLP